MGLENNLAKGSSSSVLQGSSVLGGIMSTFGAMNAARDRAEYLAKIAERNAELASTQAGLVGQAGAQEQVKIRDRAKQFTGAQKAAMSANGLDIAAGSPLAILGDTKFISEQDAQQSRYNTSQRMWGLEQQSFDYRSLAEGERMAGENNATTALLTGTSQLLKNFNAYGSLSKTRNSDKFAIKGGTSKTT